MLINFVLLRKKSFGVLENDFEKEILLKRLEGFVFSLERLGVTLHCLGEYGSDTILWLGSEP